MKLRVFAGIAAAAVALAGCATMVTGSSETLPF
jgi:hypothetical protein